MPEPDQRRAARAALESLAGRPPAAAAELAARLVRASWPSGIADRTDPVAAEWVRRWRPGIGAPPPPHCGCPARGCLVCN